MSEDPSEPDRAIASPRPPPRDAAPPKPAARAARGGARAVRQSAIAQGRGYDGCPADVWSTGATLLETLLGRAAFSKLWLEAYKNYTTLTRARLLENVRRRQAAVLERAALLYDDETAGNWRETLLRVPCDDPDDEPMASQFHPRSPELDTPLPGTMTSQPEQGSGLRNAERVSSPSTALPSELSEPFDIGAAEATRRRAIARELVMLVFGCLAIDLRARTRSTAGAETARTVEETARRPFGTAALLNDDEPTAAHWS